MYNSSQDVDKLTDHGFHHYSLPELTTMMTDHPPDVTNLTDHTESHEDSPLEVTTVIALLFGSVSLLLNLTVLLALYQVKNRISTHYQLIISLAVSDMLVASSVLLIYFINKLYTPLAAAADSRWTCVPLIINALNITGLTSTLFNLIMMALDHYLAIIKPLHYPVLLTKSKVTMAISASWTLSCIIGFSEFLSGGQRKDKWAHLNYCQVVARTYYQQEYIVFAIVPICISVMMFMYTRICVKVWQRNRADYSVRSRMPGRSTKAIVTTLLHIVTFALCYLPILLFEVTLIIKVKTDPRDLEDNMALYSLINSHLFNLFILNAILDPIIYTVRMREVRVGFRRLLPACCLHCLPAPLPPRHPADLQSASVTSRHHRALSLKPLTKTSSGPTSTALLKSASDKARDGQNAVV